MWSQQCTISNERFTLGRSGEGPTLVLREMKSQTRNKGNFETFTPKIVEIAIIKTDVAFKT